jgi:hypothetical protein
MFADKFDHSVRKSTAPVKFNNSRPGQLQLFKDFELYLIGFLCLKYDCKTVWICVICINPDDRRQGLDVQYKWLTNGLIQQYGEGIVTLYQIIDSAVADKFAFINDNDFIANIPDLIKVVRADD